MYRIITLQYKMLPNNQQYIRTYTCNYEKINYYLVGDPHKHLPYSKPSPSAGACCKEETVFQLTEVSLLSHHPGILESHPTSNK